MHADNFAFEDEQKSFVLKGWHVFLIFLGFFGVMFAVNGVFLYHAITSFPGEDVKKSYVQGLDYNSKLAARKSQDELGWSAAAGYVEGNLVLRLSDDEGHILYEHDVEAELRYATNAKNDQVVKLAPSASGDYLADVNGLRPGEWTVRFDVRERPEGEIVFQAHKEFVIRP